jgi:hypothetical protein
MRRVSKAVAVASLLVALTTSNIYALPSKSGAQPTLGSKIARLIRQIIGLGDLSLPHP